MCREGRLQRAKRIGAHNGLNQTQEQRQREHGHAHGVHPHHPLIHGLRHDLSHPSTRPREVHSRRTTRRQMFQIPQRLSVRGKENIGITKVERGSFIIGHRLQRPECGSHWTTISMQAFSIPTYETQMISTIPSWRSWWRRRGSEHQKWFAGIGPEWRQLELVLGSPQYCQWVMLWEALSDRVDDSTSWTSIHTRRHLLADWVTRRTNQVGEGQLFVDKLGGLFTHTGTGTRTGYRPNKSWKKISSCTKQAIRKWKSDCKGTGAML